MQRVVVMGPPGSGKSTLARRIGARHGLPVFHLDQAYWQPGWIETPAAQFKAEVARLAALPAWVIDGNYTDAIGPRLGSADTVIYLDVPSWLSVLRVAVRTLLAYGRVRRDSARGCPERLDAGFLQFAWSWNRIRRARNLALVEGFAGRQVILRSAAAQRRWVRDELR